MSRFSTLILSVVWLIGTFLLFVPLFDTLDALQFPFSESIYYLITSFIMAIVVITFRDEVSRKSAIMNNIIITIFTIESIILALACISTQDLQIRAESLSGSIFFFAGMIVSSTLFFVKSKV